MKGFVGFGRKAYFGTTALVILVIFSWLIISRPSPTVNHTTDRANSSSVKMSTGAESNTQLAAEPTNSLSTTAPNNPPSSSTSEATPAAASNNPQPETQTPVEPHEELRSDIYPCAMPAADKESLVVHSCGDFCPKYRFIACIHPM
jgi:hypothetical protein